MERSLGADTWSASGSTGRIDEEMMMNHEGFLMMMHYAFLAWKVQKQDASC